jgi:hypothetical protein
MPFDALRFRQPIPTVLPPQPPERDGAAAFTGCTAQAAFSSWRSHREGFMTRYRGNDRDGGQWTGNSYDQGSTTFSEFNRPRGESMHCRWSYDLGWQALPTASERP